MQHIVSDEEFETIVSEGIDRLDSTFIDHLKNVAITTADMPSREQMRKGRVGPHGLLLGLYEGVPQTVRNNNYSGVLPDKITIFKIPITMLARDEQHLRELVYNTVWHEIAHHYGLDHTRIRELEEKD